MKSLNELLPELRGWNDGKGVDALDYVFACATSELTVALVSLFWPEFCAFEGYVFRAGFILENVRLSEKLGSRSPPQIEAAANYLGLGDLFRRESDSPLLNKRINFLGECLAKIYQAKLGIDFPDREFSVILCQEEEDYYLTFFQGPSGS